MADKTEWSREELIDLLERADAPGSPAGIKGSPFRWALLHLRDAVAGARDEVQADVARRARDNTLKRLEAKLLGGQRWPDAVDAESRAAIVQVIRAAIDDVRAGF